MTYYVAFSLNKDLESNDSLEENKFRLNKILTREQKPIPNKLITSHNELYWTY